MGRRATASRVLSLVVIAGLTASACSYRVRDVVPEIPDEAQSSRIYAADGSLLTVFHAEENRTNIALSDIPDDLKNAVIAIEDERFYRHKGVDLRAVLRALRTNAEEGEIAEGGSTITQQYVKNALISDDDQTLQRKIEEASIAYQLERKYTKDRILELYLNTIYFGNGAYGVQAAANEYFAKPVTELNVAESALLAGLIQAPARTDPFDVPDVALDRRSVVLDQMVVNDFLTADEADRAADDPLALADETPTADEQYSAPYFVEDVKQWILNSPQFGETPEERRNLLFGGGLRIHTTVDLRMQFLAEVAVAQILPDPSTSPSAALVAIEPRTGYVRAMVGGRDFFGDRAQKFNLATQGPRQAGSSFKPIVLATALADEIPLNKVYAAPGRIVIPQKDGAPDWAVSNYGGGGAGAVTLLEATVRSYNTVYAQLIMDVGPEHAVERAEAYGIRTPMQGYPSAVLGTQNVTALDMASAYATFANRGVHVPPVMVTRILNPDGTVRFENRHTQSKVLEAGTADTLTSVLQQVIQRGTGTKADIGRPAAGKTGTAQAWKDAWFVGYTPDLATSVWLGFRDEEIPMAPPNTPIRVTGGSWPAQIWSAFMRPAHDNIPVAEFPAPPTTTTTTTTPRFIPGPSPAPQSQANTSIVPSLIGLSWREAQPAIEQNGFVARRVDAYYGVKKNRVMAQSPAAGTRAAPGSTVTVECDSG